MTVERNTITDLRREQARASGEEANAPTACGETGLFTLLSGDTLPPGGWSFGLVLQRLGQAHRLQRPGRWRVSIARSSSAILELTYGVACGRTDDLDPDAQLSLDDFIASLGATPPGPACGIITTYVGAGDRRRGKRPDAAARERLAAVRGDRSAASPSRSRPHADPVQRFRGQRLHDPGRPGAVPLPVSRLTRIARTA